MTQNYDPILVFWFKHRYFKDELFRTIELSLAESTQKTFRDLDLILKPFQGGFYLLASNPELLDSPGNSIPLQFFIFTKDVQYINYTELPPYDLRTKILYFNNRASHLVKENKYLLHPEEHVSGSEIVQVIQSEISIPEYNPNKNYRFTDASGKELSAGSVRVSTSNPGTFILSGIEAGLVRVFSSNDEILKVYCYPKSVWKKPMAILELFPDELFSQYKAKNKVEYSIYFDNRKTIWKYFFTNKKIQEKDKLGIINKDKQQVFLPPQLLPVHQNLKALVFESKNKIPLFESSDEIFQLADFTDPKKAPLPVLKNLPKASSEQLFTDPSKSSDQVYSHIYI